MSELLRVTLVLALFEMVALVVMLAVAGWPARDVNSPRPGLWEPERGPFTEARMRFIVADLVGLGKVVLEAAFLGACLWGFLVLASLIGGPQ